MDPSELTPAAGALTLMAPLFLLGVAVAFSLRATSAARVGQPVHVHRAVGWNRRLSFLGLALLAVAAVLVPEAPTVAALAVLFLAALLVLLTPAPEDSAVGADGVRTGFSASRFTDLEEWRLTGEHLRWRMPGGEWISSFLPPEQHAAVRERLTALAPERESRFQH